MSVTRCALINATDLMQYAIIEPVQGDIDYDGITKLQDALPPVHLLVPFCIPFVRLL